MRRLSFVAAIVLVAVLTAAVGFQLGESSGRLAHPIHGGSPSTAVRPTPVVTSLPASSGATSPRWGRAAGKFVLAFLDASRLRGPRLRRTASPRLAGLLIRTDPVKIPSGSPLGPPDAVREGPEFVTVVQRLSNGSSFAFDLVPDVAAQYGWLVTSVRPGER